MDLGKIREKLSIGREEAAVLTLRLSLGWVFLTSGLSKLFEYGFAYPEASGYLSSAVPIKTPEIALTFPELLGLPGLLLVELGTFVVEPLMQVFASVPFIGTLVVITELFIGLSLLLGLFTRVGSVVGASMMVLFYYGNAGWSNGLLNADAVYLILFISLIALKAGEKLSVDRYLSEKMEKDNRLVKALIDVR